MTYPLVLDLAADGIPVTVTCRVLGFSKQAFYKWKANPVTAADLERAYLINAALDVHGDDPELGYRFIADELEDKGLQVSCNTVHSLCREAGIVAAVHRRRGSGKKAGPPVHDDHVQRVFTASGPNQVWLTDITEHWTSEGKLYMCAVKDVFSNRIVGYAIDSRMKSSLAVAAVECAVARRAATGIDVTGVTCHSDRGSQGGFNGSSQHLDRVPGLVRSESRYPVDGRRRRVLGLSVCCCRIRSRFGSPGRSGLTHVGNDPSGVFALICQPHGRAVANTAPVGRDLIGAWSLSTASP